MRCRPATLLVPLLSAWAGAQPPAPTATVERSVLAMGTTFRLRVRARDRDGALTAAEAAVRAVEAVEARLSTWRPDSELARLNRAPANEPVALSAALASDLARAGDLCRDTAGAFDPGVGALVRAWGLRAGGRLPSPDELARARAGSGMRLLDLGTDGRVPSRAVRRHPDLLLEEGGFGKGAGLDAAAAALGEARALGAVLDLGGQVLLVGEAGGELGVAHPRERGRTVCTLRIDRGSLATSGNSERGAVVRGRRIGHLLDPRSGRPAPDFGSVTVWAGDAFTADCLSTALFVMGPEAALAWAERRPGVEALVLEAGGARLRARGTSGLRGRAQALPPDLEIELPERRPGT